jgi:hypothetical protein
MPSIPIPLLGRHITSVTARWQLADSAGLLGNGTGSLQTLTGVLSGIEPAFENLTEEINVLTDTVDNEVAVEQDDVYVLTEVVRNGASSSYEPILPALWFNADSADHVLLTIIQGGMTTTFYAVMTEIDFPELRKGKNECRMTIRTVDVGAATANPSYA